jgi:hypothetical protein
LRWSDPAAELELLNLAHGGAGQGVQENHVAGVLVAGEAVNRARASSRVKRIPGLATTQATAVSPQAGSGRPTTAASAICGQSDSTFREVLRELQRGMF